MRGRFLPEALAASSRAKRTGNGPGACGKATQQTQPGQHRVASDNGPARQDRPQWGPGDVREIFRKAGAVQPWSLRGKIKDSQTRLAESLLT